MRVHLIKWYSVQAYAQKHSTSIPGFLVWHGLIKKADWKTINDLRKTFPSADLIGDNRLVFNIGGNNHRVICKYHFGKKFVHLFIMWIGTHAEYTKLCKEGKQHTVDDY